MSKTKEVTVSNRYSMPPFGLGKESWRKRWEENDGAVDADICCICGRSLKDSDKAETGVVVGGGDSWGDDSYANDPGFMGSFPIGSDCHKKYLIKGTSNRKGE